MTNKKESVLDVIHQTATGFHQAGVMKVETMRAFDALCLPPVKIYTPAQIRRIRLKNKTSQAVFAGSLILCVE